MWRDTMNNVSADHDTTNHSENCFAHVTYMPKITIYLAQLAAAAEYIDCISAEE